MPRRLKVFATDMGFVRAVVAAPSRKAALEAWGVRDDLFARGTAEEIDDPALVKEATASPGEVLRKPLVKGAPGAAPARISSKAQSAVSRKTHRTPKPPPSTEALEAAEAALKARKEEQAAALKEIATGRQSLDARERDQRAAGDKAIKIAEEARDKARKAHDAALRKWSADGGD